MSPSLLLPLHVHSSRVSRLGYVDLCYATRPIADILADVRHWSDRPADGVWLDRAPTSPFSIGPVARVVRTARQVGLVTVVLNPGTPTDPLYRELDLVICTFDGSWRDYRDWAGSGSRPGDVHLVHSVPVTELPVARRLLRERGASGLVTDQPGWPGIPTWLTAASTLS